MHGKREGFQCRRAPKRGNNASGDTLSRRRTRTSVQEGKGIAGHAVGKTKGNITKRLARRRRHEASDDLAGVQGAEVRLVDEGLAVAGAGGGGGRGGGG